MIEFIAFRRITVLWRPVDPSRMSCGRFDPRLTPYLLNGDIHQDTPFGPLGIVYPFHGFHPLIGKEIPHRINDQFLLPILIHNLSRLDDMRMTTQDDIRTPRNHLMV